MRSQEALGTKMEEEGGMPDTYRTVTDAGRAELKARGSRFIGEARPARTEAAAQSAVAAIREREHKATHHCFAYRLQPSGNAFRYDDDGEPSGTAGPPILRQIDARDLTNTLVVVTRYFGGTKLGTGGLVRAYGGAADGALEDATIETEVVRERLRLQFAYDDTAPANRVLEQFDTVVTDESYTDVTRLTVAVRRSEAGAFAEAFTNALGGRGQVERAETAEP
jgi:uncharacterized YigZ family protein